MVTTAVEILNINPDAQQYDNGTGPIFFKSCGKLYFYLSTPVNVSHKNISINFDLIAYEKKFNFSEGFAECTKYGVKLLSFETFAELECLFNYNKGKYCTCTINTLNFPSETDFAHQSAYFWTSGTNLGPLTAKTYAWCSTNEFFNISKTKVWDVDQSQPDGYWVERCTSLDWQKDFLYKNGMHDFGCKDRIGIICEI